jgi:hypothetical protein
VKKPLTVLNHLQDSSENRKEVSMPRYYVNIGRENDNFIRKRIINHCNIDYFEQTLNKSGFIIKSFAEVADDVNLEDVIEIEATTRCKEPFTGLIGE